METGYQRGKIQEESMHCEMQKHSGEYPIVDVNTFRNPHRDAVPDHIELARSTAEENQSQLARLADFHARHAAEAPAMLKRLQQAVIANKNAFEVLMDAVRVCSLGQITNALFEGQGVHLVAGVFEHIGQHDLERGRALREDQTELGQQAAQAVGQSGHRGS